MAQNRNAWKKKGSGRVEPAYCIIRGQFRPTQFLVLHSTQPGCSSQDSLNLYETVQVSAPSSQICIGCRSLRTRLIAEAASDCVQPKATEQIYVAASVSAQSSQELVVSHTLSFDTYKQNPEHRRLATIEIINVKKRATKNTYFDNWRDYNYGRDYGTKAANGYGPRMSDITMYPHSVLIVPNITTEFKRGRVNLSEELRDGRPSTAFNIKNIDDMHRVIEIKQACDLP
ncbi:hypothetical protein EVAR_22172_1 [Eumeta japonica]|uniref:Uncharacterized protein n=1 Tax=Eumeta variegata TaxID=151549 RepID=A0A4C1XV48_EUMVA|nr:hypothetical protein EVAR_22172_1 [Eumeta japonica]